MRDPSSGGVPTGAPLLCVQEQPEAKTQKG